MLELEGRLITNSAEGLNRIIKVQIGVDAEDEPVYALGMVPINPETGEVIVGGGGGGDVTIVAPIPAGTNNIGDVGVAGGTVTANLGTLNGAATADKQDTLLGTALTGETTPSGSGLLGWLSAIRKKLAAFGTAGSPSADVVSVQGVIGGVAQPVVLNADARYGALSSGLWTLGSTAAVESIAVPDWARGFRLRPSADTKFAVGEDPAANGTETLTVGNTAYANETEVRLLESGTGRTLRLLTTTAASTCGVGFF